jgi:uncharacterized protein (DUF983 family)
MNQNFFASFLLTKKKSYLDLSSREAANAAMEPPDETHEIWPPPGLAFDKPEWTMPGWGAAIRRGMRGVCPSCGQAAIFDGYLRVFPACRVCAAPLGDMPADDAPPYIAMLVVAHFIGIVVVAIFRFGLQPNIFGYGFLLLLLVAICMIALRIAKGAVIAILLKLGNRREALG